MILVAMVLALGTPHARADEAEQFFPYQVHHHQLDNGLDVYVVPMASPGVVAYYSWVSVGSRDEVDRGRTGFAHFFEHLMFHGTEAMGKEARELSLVRMGAEENAWTWLDETVYHARLAKQHLPRHIELEADRFQHLALTPDGVRKEAGAVYGEWRKSQADPGFKLLENVYATAFTKHTYKHDTLGYEADIADMPSAYDYASGFFSLHYRPENTDIIVAGDADPDEVFGWVEAAYSSWAPSGRARPAIPAEPPQKQMREVHVDWPAPTAPRLSLSWKTTGSNPDDADAAALELVGDLLLSDVGPLQRRIVEQEGLAYAVYGGRDPFLDPGLFMVVAEAKGPDNFGRIEEIIRAEIAALIEGVDPARLEETRTRARYALLTSLDTPQSAANTLGWWLRRGGSPDAVDRFLRGYVATTADDVSRVVAETFVDTSLTRGTLVSAGGEE